MKKTSALLTSLAIVILFSFTSGTPADNPEKNGNEFLCSAPTNLSATLNVTGSGAYLILNWSSGTACQWSYGGSYTTSSGGTYFFGAPTYTWPVSITVPNNTNGVTFRVTAVCCDGTGSSTSAPYHRTFP